MAMSLCVRERGRERERETFTQLIRKIEEAR